MVRRKALSIGLGDQWACWASWARVYERNWPPDPGAANTATAFSSCSQLAWRFWHERAYLVVYPMQASQAYDMHAVFLFESYASSLFFLSEACMPPMITPSSRAVSMLRRPMDGLFLRFGRVAHKKLRARL